MSTRTRYEINIAFTDRGGTKRFVNRVATLWFDGQRGNIEIPPGVALYGQEGVFINVDLPRDQREGGAPGGGYGRGASGRTGRPEQGRERQDMANYHERGSPGDDEIPF